MPHKKIYAQYYITIRFENMYYVYIYIYTTAYIYIYISSLSNIELHPALILLFQLETAKKTRKLQQREKAVKSQ